jgi:hypothetical protein
MAHNVTEERNCLRWHQCGWGNDTGEFYCTKCELRFFCDPTPHESLVRLLCIECAPGLKAV